MKQLLYPGQDANALLTGTLGDEDSPSLEITGNISCVLSADTGRLINCTSCLMCCRIHTLHFLLCLIQICFHQTASLYIDEEFCRLPSGWRRTASSSSSSRHIWKSCRALSSSIIYREHVSKMSQCQISISVYERRNRKVSWEARWRPTVTVLWKLVPHVCTKDQKQRVYGFAFCRCRWPPIALHSTVCRWWPVLSAIVPLVSGTVFLSKHIHECFLITPALHALFLLSDL